MNLSKFRACRGLFLSTLVAVGPLATAQIDIGTTNTGDGANVTVSGTVQWNLSEAATLSWNAVPPIPGKGVYDPVQWAVVYKFGNLTIASGATLTFANHPTNAPVVILVQGTFTCNGTINLNGGVSVNSTGLSVPGPGGFAGGGGYTLGTQAGSGTGPGGGLTTDRHGGAGSYRTLGAGPSGPIYGWDRCLPLVGGSGGAGATYIDNNQWPSGAAGGGAILIAARESIVFGPSGVISCVGGAGSDFGYTSAGGGSGGTTRLVSNSIATQSTSRINASGGSNSPGGHGRVRIEHNSGAFTGVIAGTTGSFAAPGPVAQIWPESTAPKCVIRQVGPVVIGPDPYGGFTFPDAVVSSASAQTVSIECSNVPVDGTWTVTLRVTRRFGPAQSMTATLQPGGNFALSTWTVNVNFGDNLSTLIARAFRIS